MIWGPLFSFYYRNKWIIESLFMIIIGAGVFLLFWFLPPTVTTWDKAMHVLGYACASLSFVFGWIFLLGIAPKSMKQSYKITEQMVIENEGQKHIITTPSLLALNKTVAFFAPVFALVILGVMIWDYTWQNIGYVLILAVIYYLYKYIQQKKSSSH